MFLFILLSLTLTFSQFPNPQLFVLPPNLTQPLSLNEQLQCLSQNFLTNFQTTFYINDEPNLQAIRRSPGQYLLLLGKMHLYGIYTPQMVPPSNAYLMAYFYLKTAAHQYQHPQAYYMLGILQFYRITPAYALYHSLNQTKKLKNHLKQSHWIHTEDALYMASLLGHTGATYILAHFKADGVGMKKNCKAGVAYYISIVKDTIVDKYVMRRVRQDPFVFDKELYLKRKAKFKGEYEPNISELQNIVYKEKDTIEMLWAAAQNYFYGIKGYKRNCTLAMQLYAKLASMGEKYSMYMLGLGYLQGQCIPHDMDKAKKLFQASGQLQFSSSVLQLLKYYDGEENRKQFIKYIQYMFKNNESDKLDSLTKQMFGSIIAKGEVKGVSKDQGFVILSKLSAEGLIFLEGSYQFPFDCNGASSLFGQTAMQFPFFAVPYTLFQDRLIMAKIALRDGFPAFSLIKYLQLVAINHQDSFVNAIYLLDVYNALNINPNSWSLTLDNALYTYLRSQNIVPDLQSSILSQFQLIGNNPSQVPTRIKSDSFLMSDPTIHTEYVIMKILKLKKDQNNILNYYLYKKQLKVGVSDEALLKKISTQKGNREYILQARYLLTRKEHAAAAVEGLSFKDQFKLKKQYMRIVESERLGQGIFMIEDHLMRNVGLLDTVLETAIVNRLVNYLFVITLLAFGCYYKRTRKLREKKENQKISQEIQRKKQINQRMKKQEEKIIQNKYEDEESRNQPIIVQNKWENQYKIKEI